MSNKPDSVPSSEHLYPVVQDLTEAEYSVGTAGTGLFCGGMLGSFALEDLALPIANVRSLPPSAEPATSTSTKQKTRHSRHSRGHSLFQLPSSMMAALVGVQHPHKRSNSAPHQETVDSCPTDETLPESSEDEEQDNIGPISFDDAFVLTRQIYRGNISSVWECVHREQGSRHCVKIIDKRRFKYRSDKESALREIALLTSLQTYQSSSLCPRLVQVTEDSHQYYLVMDYVQGGNLAAQIQKQHQQQQQQSSNKNIQEQQLLLLTEDHVQSIARSLLQCLAELHQLSVAHFNLTPDNILLEPNLCDVVLSDFGNAWDLENKNTSLSVISATSTSTGLGGTTTIHDHGVIGSCRSLGSGMSSSSSSTRKSHPRVGSLHYAAPELMGSEKEFGLAADMWSVGVIMYELFCGQLPFEEASKRALKEKIASGKYQFNGPEWHDVSRGAKQFISTLLHPDPQVRMTVQEALAHPWIAQPLVLGEGEDSSPSSSPRGSKGNRRKRRPSLVHRLWRHIRSNYPGESSSLSSSSSSSPVTTVPTHRRSSSAANLTYTPPSPLVGVKRSGTASTIISVTTSSTSHSFSANANTSWDPSLPQPLDHFRRPSMTGL